VSDEQDLSLPTIRVGSADESAENVLREIRLVALKHPEAFRAALASLRTEGRSFGQTLEGQRCREQLSRSALLNRVSLLWPYLGAEPACDDATPSQVVESLFRIASSPTRDRILDRWLGQERGL